MGNEISYPFSSDSAGGGQQMVSQAQWQMMSRMFGPDRIDTQLVSSSYDGSALPFAASVVNGTSVSVSPGRALVGGFYYQLTAAQSVAIAANTGTNPRVDLIVLRADLAAGSVNLAVVQGQAAASPVVPQPTRTLGGRWELPLHQVTVPGNNGTLSVLSVGPFDMPSPVAVPWNASQLAQVTPVGTYIYDLDSNTNDTQSEYFVGRDGVAVTRHLGKARPYTPSLVNATDPLPTSYRTGRWRIIAPGMVWFAVTINNQNDGGAMLSGKNWIMGITLPPVPAATATRQVLHGHITNARGGGNLPNYMSVTALIEQGGTGQTTAYLYYPSPTTPAQGLDALPGIPAGAILTLSGVYQTNVYGD
ncbi:MULTISPECIES: hypothetical protein [Streptomycetaceae]|uniref:Uncharacterized protein n=1 Tax=Streptantibioticus cattleyicolor (strain ATCC 35852 / DSM 46488 / JCM 4925 / NBRC 14057 / NRRL 8057) TaxID=1003195 RepID=F8JPZ5_STREN|nr:MULTISPECIES: hypothetical protein [Streptomycetaceae]AEW94055.1 hypothetical protein SCATT_16840 [Streptantibioticus cattleyicolor NRRL 8057 = DSM 46488]MYS58728.1 hypothetical protein [Streptomyces sp. SID5468]CCB74407.1 protein of unknown function [Streptantibioticus cattleyicolor NRRL 8057 = DSM 46488]